MEAQYYVPEISEFHVGFEYEEYNDWIEQNDNEPTWNRKTIFTHNANLTALNVSLQKNEIRVKHLDIQDIESLGWEISKIQRNPKTTCFEKSDTAFRFVLEIDIDSVKIDAYLDFKIPMFIGSVKNKSELKKLMQMLNIK